MDLRYFNEAYKPQQLPQQQIDPVNWSQLNSAVDQYVNKKESAENDLAKFATSNIEHDMSSETETNRAKAIRDEMKTIYSDFDKKNLGLGWNRKALRRRIVESGLESELEQLKYNASKMDEYRKNKDIVMKNHELANDFNTYGEDALSAYDTDKQNVFKGQFSAYDSAKRNTNTIMKTAAETAKYIKDENGNIKMHRGPVQTVGDVTYASTIGSNGQMEYLRDEKGKPIVVDYKSGNKTDMYAIKRSDNADIYSETRGAIDQDPAIKTKLLYELRVDQLNNLYRAKGDPNISKLEIQREAKQWADQNVMYEDNKESPEASQMIDDYLRGTAKQYENEALQNTGTSGHQGGSGVQIMSNSGNDNDNEVDEEDRVNEAGTVGVSQSPLPNYRGVIPMRTEEETPSEAATGKYSSYHAPLDYEALNTQQWQAILPAKTKEKIKSLSQLPDNNPTKQKLEKELVLELDQYNKNYSTNNLLFPIKSVPAYYYIKDPVKRLAKVKADNEEYLGDDNPNFENVTGIINSQKIVVPKYDFYGTFAEFKKKYGSKHTGQKMRLNEITEPGNMLTYNYNDPLFDDAYRGNIGGEGDKGIEFFVTKKTSISSQKKDMVNRYNKLRQNLDRDLPMEDDITNEYPNLKGYNQKLDAKTGNIIITTPDKRQHIIPMAPYTKDGKKVSQRAAYIETLNYLSKNK